MSPTASELHFIDQRSKNKDACWAWKQDEHAFQRTLIAEMEVRAKQEPALAFLHAIPNGGARSKAAAGKMKAEGQKSGVPDLCLPLPRKTGGVVFHGLYLELKKAGGSISPEQWKWLLHLHRAGYAVYVANDLRTARMLILDYLKLSAP